MDGSWDFGSIKSARSIDPFNNFSGQHATPPITPLSAGFLDPIPKSPAQKQRRTRQSVSFDAADPGRPEFKELMSEAKMKDELDVEEGYKAVDLGLDQSRQA